MGRKQCKTPESGRYNFKQGVKKDSQWKDGVWAKTQKSWGDGSWGYLRDKHSSTKALMWEHLGPVYVATERPTWQEQYKGRSSKKWSQRNMLNRASWTIVSTLAFTLHEMELLECFQLRSDLKFFLMRSSGCTVLYKEGIGKNEAS